jgi:hypothetical protein
LDQAREGILVGLANSRHLAQTPFYVNQLVALAIQRIILKRADELISQPDSPNLYWALSKLPDSLVELDRAASFEADMFEQTFPAVRDLDRPRDTKEWHKMARQLVELLELLGEIPKQERPQGDGSVVEQFFQNLQPEEKNHLTKAVERARADLPRMLKIPAEKVAAMSDDEACVRWYSYLRMAHDQHAAAIIGLPPREAWPQLKKLQQEVESMEEMTGTSGFGFLSGTSIYVSTWSLKRKIDALRIIEAVRHHLASHKGQLPAALDEIKEVSIPIDRLTDKPYEWKVDGKTAILKAPPLPLDVVEPGSEAAKTGALEYRLQVR